MQTKSPINPIAQAKTKTALSIPAVKKNLTRAQIQQAMKERQRLRAAEYYTKNPIRSSIQKRGQMVGRRIGALQAQQKKGQSS